MEQIRHFRHVGKTNAMTGPSKRRGLNVALSLVAATMYTSVSLWIGDTAGGDPTFQIRPGVMLTNTTPMSNCFRIPNQVAIHGNEMIFNVARYESQLRSSIFQCEKILLVLLFLVSIHPAFSQLGYGLKGGPQMVSASGTSMRFSYHAGVFGTYRLSENLFLGIDVLYARKGFTTKDGETDAKMEGNLNYLSIPIFTEYNFAKRFFCAGSG